MTSAGLRYFLRKPHGWFFFLASRGLTDWIPDEPYLRLLFRFSHGYALDLDHPKTINEKIQWLKLYDRRPLYTLLSDKLAVKDYVAQRLGEDYVIPRIAGPWKSAAEIDFDALPGQFVLKCTHDSGGFAICRDKELFDREAARDMLARRLGRNYYYIQREWTYRDVPPRVFAEKYIPDCALFDYKVMCFSGQPRLIQMHKNRFGAYTQDFYDTDWKPLDFSLGLPHSAAPDPRPPFLDELLDLSRQLGAGLPHVRLDWYRADGRLYFGEFTFYDGSGLDPYVPTGFDRLFGDMLDLPTDNPSFSRKGEH